MRKASLAGFPQRPDPPTGTQAPTADPPIPLPLPGTFVDPYEVNTTLDYLTILFHLGGISLVHASLPSSRSPSRIHDSPGSQTDAAPAPALDAASAPRYYSHESAALGRRLATAMDTFPTLRGVLTLERALRKEWEVVRDGRAEAAHARLTTLAEAGSVLLGVVTRHTLRTGGHVEDALQSAAALLANALRFDSMNGRAVVSLV